MKTLPIILICSGVTFVSSVSYLICETCTAQNAATCSGSKVPCDPSVTSCLSGMTEISYKTATIKVPQKSCGFEGICHLSYSFTLHDIHIASEAQCCKSDECNKDIPPIAPRNLTKNGLKCPYCLQPGLSGCTPENQTLCTGLEDRCIKFSGFMGFGESPQEVSYQGCATPSTCPVTQESSLDADSGISITCTEAVRHYNDEGDQSLPVIN